MKTVGLDLDVNTSILAKANLLIHLADEVRNPTTTLQALNLLMAETFVLTNGNETLGSLANPPVGTIDVILTNPPYVTQGSSVYREGIAATRGRRNGVDLRDHYGRCGMGVEALFLRYISGALKPGGRAFLIVPLGLLNRTDPGPKARLLEECDIIASIALPRNTFFYTPQPTYIIGLEKRHTEAEVRGDVFCAIARTIGESLDYRRILTPDENDLERIADLFLEFCDGDSASVAASPLVKIVRAEQFGKDDRWDVHRFWSEEEFVELGVRESAVERTAFIDSAREQLDEIAGELVAARSELEILKPSKTRTVMLSDEALFAVRPGTRIRNEDIRANPGGNRSARLWSAYTSGGVDA